MPSVERVSRGVSAIYVHTSYTVNPRTNDIAVLRVLEPFILPHNTIEPALRNNQTIRLGTVCQFAGWGTLTNVATSGLDPIQRRLNATILPTASCTAANAQMICAGHIAPGTNNPVSNFLYTFYIGLLIQ